MSLDPSAKLFKGGNLPTVGALLREGFARMQVKLISGQNIKTINNETILGDGNISIPEGPQGPQGIGIQSIAQTVESNDSDGINEITVTLTDGTTIVFRVKNGSVGAQGVPGVANAKYRQVTTLPTASAATMDYIYLVESATSGVYDMSYTEYDGSSYSWKSLGTTAIQLSDYATRDETNVHITSYRQFLLRLLVPTSYATLTDGSNPTRLRNIMYVPAGTTGSVKSTDSNGVYCALYDTASHACQGSTTTGRLESYGSGASCDIKTTQAGWLLVSLSNGTTVITEERKQELLDSLTVDITIPSLYADKTIKLSNEVLIRPMEELGGYIGKNFISNTSLTWNAGGMHYMIPATDLRGKRFYIKSGTSAVRYAFLTDSTTTATTKPSFCSGTSLVTVASGGNYNFVIIPNDCNYIYIYATYTTSTFFPDSVAIADSIFNDTLNSIDDNSDDIAAVDERIDELIEGLFDIADYDGHINKTITPSADETYNAYYKTSLSSHFSDASVDSTAKKRLLYYPDVILKGGQIVRITTTGLNGITLYELPYRRPGTSPVGAFTSGDILTTHSIAAASGAGTFEFTLQDATCRIAFVLGATQNVNTTPDEITNTITSVVLPIIDVSSATPKTNSRLNEIRQARYVNSSPTIPSLGLLHYSDIHGDDISKEKILDIISKYTSQIDAVVSTGDVVSYFADPTGSYPNASAWWKASGLAEKSLFVLGNHDGALATGDHVEASADWDAKGKAWDFDTYFADYISELGITMPSGYDDSSSQYYKSCFWHKDFASAKIRIIGIDGIHFNETFRYTTGEQETWLAARLADTLDSNNDAYGYSVIFLCHYPLDDWSGDNETWDDATHKFIFNCNAAGGRVMSYKTGAHVNFHLENSGSLSLDKRFSMRTKVSNASSPYGYDKGTVNPIGDIIQTWVDSGGKYVAWLCGHCHYDMFFYPAKYPDLLCVAVNQAGNIRGTNHADRGTDLDARVCVNFYSIDTENGLFKIVRFGLASDRFMANINTLCYDYVNREVINER